MPAAATSTSATSTTPRWTPTSWAPAAASATPRAGTLTIKPGAYPWGNHHNAWRPAHIHLSLFGHTLQSRLVTQVYFPGDPLLAFDPIFKGVPEGARERLISRFSLDVTEPGIALGYEFDIVLRGRRQTPLEA